MILINKLIRDENGGSPTIAFKSIVIISALALLMFLLIDLFYMWYVYRYIKGQQDLANRAVYAEIDTTRLADRELYIDENAGRRKFEEYLELNLGLNGAYQPGRDIKIVGAVRIKEFHIYNQDELPATTPSGQSIDLVSVYSEIEVDVVPFLIKYGTLRFNPRLTTDLPDFLVKTFHPS